MRLGDIYMISTQYLHDIYRISTGYLHGSLALVTVIPANCAIIIMLLLFSRLAT